MLATAGIGDVIRAWRVLGATTEGERRAIARLLGFDLGEEAPDRTTIATAEPEVPRPQPAPRPPAPQPPERTAPSTSAGDPIELVPFTDVHDDHRLPAGGFERPTAARARPLESLFAVSWQRAIACTLSARSAAVGALDVDRAIAMVAHREPIRTLPRRARLISAAEIAVVVDRRGTIAWFRADADQLIERLDAVTHSPVDVVISAGAPVLAAATGDDDEEPGGEAARVRIGPGGRVIGITDLGLGSRAWSSEGPDRTAEWIDLARRLRARGASLIIVTPVPLREIPPPLRRIAPCVHWDARTRAGLVHRLVKGLR